MTTFPTDMAPRAMALGDVNKDAKVDVVVTAGPNKITVLLGNGDGTFTAKPTVTTGSNPYGVALADLDGDGNVDLVAASAGDSTIAVNRGNGDGTFRAVETFDNGANTVPTYVDVASLDGKGKPDVFVVTGTDTADVLLGCGF
jgi:hypothetical protein